MSILKPRRKTRQVMIGDVAVGGDAPISVQSMTNTKTEDVEATVAQIRASGSRSAARSCAWPCRARRRSRRCRTSSRRLAIPVVADIHFDYRLGLGAVEAGVHALRINPGNIGARERVETLVAACRRTRHPDSRRRELGVAREGHPRARRSSDGAGMVESAMRQSSCWTASGSRTSSCRSRRRMSR